MFPNVVESTGNLRKSNTFRIGRNALVIEVLLISINARSMHRMDCSRQKSCSHIALQRSNIWKERVLEGRNAVHRIEIKS